MRMPLAAILVLLSFFSISSSASENAKSLGTEAVNAGRYAEAYRLWLPLAEKGDREVQEAVAILLAGDANLGVSITKDERTRLARHWVAQSARNGQVSAMEWLADAFKHGWLDFQVNEEAATCWKNASLGIAESSQCETFLKLSAKDTAAQN